MCVYCTVAKKDLFGPSKNLGRGLKLYNPQNLGGGLSPYPRPMNEPPMHTDTCLSCLLKTARSVTLRSVRITRRRSHSTPSPNNFYSANFFMRVPRVHAFDLCVPVFCCLVFHRTYRRCYLVARTAAPLIVTRSPLSSSRNSRRASPRSSSCVSAPRFLVFAPRAALHPQ